MARDELRRATNPDRADYPIQGLPIQGPVPVQSYRLVRRVDGNGDVTYVTSPDDPLPGEGDNQICVVRDCTIRIYIPQPSPINNEFVSVEPARIDKIASWYGNLRADPASNAGGRHLGIQFDAVHLPNEYPYAGNHDHATLYFKFPIALKERGEFEFIRFSVDPDIKNPGDDPGKLTFKG
ncbi:MAG: hypothetical protein ACREHE_17025 [Rhizomicrobium sp.]